MDTLDLHGVRHHVVDRMVENFVLLHDVPMRIIVGNSTQMKKITIAVLDRYGYSSEPENDFNLGSLIIKQLK